MNPTEVLRIVDAIHREKNIDKEIVFQGIESALVSAAKKHYGEEEDVQIHIDRESGAISGTHNGVPLTPSEISERVAAQTAKQVMIQKIREAERDALYEEYSEQKDQLVSGIIQRYDGGTAAVTLDRPGPTAEAILPRSEQIPGETHHQNERVRATVAEVRKQGSRVRIILSRTRPQLVERLFEQEIPEIGDGVIEVRAMAREPGYRTKVAVSSSDQRVDCVGACVGVRGNRIKNIVDELGGVERIDIVRWNDDMQVFIPNALQPAEVEEVILCQMLGRAIVLVREDQLSLAIGRRGQNVRLASKLCGWDIEIMTRDELDEALEKAIVGFSSLEGVSEELADRLVGEGFLTYDDLSIIEPEDLMEMGGLTREQADAIIAQAEAKAEEAEQAAAAERRRQREQKYAEEAAAADDAAPDHADQIAAEAGAEAGAESPSEVALADAPSPDANGRSADEGTPHGPIAAEHGPTGEGLSGPPPGAA
ncbi:MAG: transcription termination factor NusA [Thermoguttaceae bacterium]|jgi:N utilization substance protein A|nr:transcription termination factor NusA [Thermoguttaceae bacterium]